MVLSVIFGLPLSPLFRLGNFPLSPLFLLGSKHFFPFSFLNHHNAALLRSLRLFCISSCHKVNSLACYNVDPDFCIFSKN